MLTWIYTPAFAGVELVGQHCRGVRGGHQGVVLGLLREDDPALLKACPEDSVNDDGALEVAFQLLAS